LNRYLIYLFFQAWGEGKRGANKEEVEGGDEEQSEGKEDEPVFNTLYDIIKEYSDYAAIQVLILHIKHELA